MRVSWEIFRGFSANLLFSLVIAGTLVSPADASETLPPRWLKLLQEMVEINSGSGNVDGLEKVRERLIPEFEALGFRTTIHVLANRRKVLSFERPDAKPRVLLLGHIDTVFPITSPLPEFSRSDGELRGPGVIDMKGGIVLILQALSDLDELKDEAPLGQVRIVINDDEEIGSPDSMEKLKELAHGIPYGLIFEPALPDGSVITSLSGLHWMELTVQGRTAHAGLDFAKGLNACVALGAKLADIARLTRLNRRLTVNVGTIEGGTKPNVVCDSARAMLDIRYVDPRDRNDLLRKIRAIAARQDGFNTVLRQAPIAQLHDRADIPDMPSRSTETVFRMAREAARELGLKLTGGHASYVTDGNRLAPTGIALLIGLGPAGSGMHSGNETMLEQSYLERVKLTQGLLRILTRRSAASNSTH